MNKHLRLIGIIPPEPFFSEIRKEQEYISTTWGPIHALRTPPHITVVPPISLTTGEVGLLFGMADAIAGTINSFRIELKDYGSFKPRVVFIFPLINQGLNDLQAFWHQALRIKMPQVLEKYPDRPYHPHLTLAHKDVNREQFDKMWSYYSVKKYHASFLVEHFCVLEYGEKGWRIEKSYDLGTR